MGARLYLPTLGRFAQVDPVYGGNANSYAYPNDPVNQNDVSGKYCQLQCTANASTLQPAAGAEALRITGVRLRVSRAISMILKGVSVTPNAAFRGIGGNLVPVSPAMRADWTRYSPPGGNGFTNTLATGGANLLGINISGAMSSASDYSKVGRVVGQTGGCVGGAIGISLAAGPEAAPVGCIGGGAAGATSGAFVFGVVGFIQGAFETKDADTFSM
jgi:hypothetical protein